MTLFRAFTSTGVEDTLGVGVWDCAAIFARAGTDVAT
jgi:hypothetical protein